jgi:hypothetical protein
MHPFKRILPRFLRETFLKNVSKGRTIIRVILVVLLANLMAACSSGTTLTPTTLPADMATQQVQSLILSGTAVPGTSMPSPPPLETSATFVDNLKNGVLTSEGALTACIDPNIDYLIERMGTFDPNNMSQIIQANSFQDVDGSTRTVMEKLEIAVESYDVSTSQFVFLYIPYNILFLPNNILNDEIGQCLALIHIPDPSTLIPLFSGT